MVTGPPCAILVLLQTTGDVMSVPKISMALNSGPPMWAGVTVWILVAPLTVTPDAATPPKRTVALVLNLLRVTLPHTRDSNGNHSSRLWENRRVSRSTLHMKTPVDRLLPRVFARRGSGTGLEFGAEIPAPSVRYVGRGFEGFHRQIGR